MIFVHESNKRNRRNLGRSIAKIRAELEKVAPNSREFEILCGRLLALFVIKHDIAGPKKPFVADNAKIAIWEIENKERGLREFMLAAMEFYTDDEYFKRAATDKGTRINSLSTPFYQELRNWDVVIMDEAYIAALKADQDDEVERINKSGKEQKLIEHNKAYEKIRKELLEINKVRAGK
ncbi:MAG: hypothetical protein FWD15_01340 [Alphaproteobacteria bacterium]|nr:hypothetical protein [Alphaproteobacteria bacterium]